MLSAQSGSEQIIVMLVENGAALNLKNAEGKTAADLAGAKKHFKIAEYLGKKINP
ncbi:MAG TPA: hypothetical protein DDY86_10880 [Syntrophaceae bacterium]|jgi:ankyrin repeat protein|nr:hypothetical protein [Syntrophaceae bacterium]